MRGDETAFTILLDRHLSTIQALAYYMLGDAHLAEDAAQSTFLKTWQMLPNWQPGQARLLTWVRRVTKNHCLDVLKKKRPVLMDIVPDVPDEASTSFDDIAMDEQKQAVMNAMAELSGNQRLALTLSYYQNVSQTEGASIMDISVSAYESLLVRARKSLGKRLSDNNFTRIHETAH